MFAAGCYTACDWARQSDSRSAARGYLAVGLLLCAVNAGVRIATNTCDSDGVTGAALLAADLTGGGAACALVCMLRHWTQRPAPARRAVRAVQILFAAAVVAMGVLFTAAPSITDEGRGCWHLMNQQSNEVSAYTLLYTVLIGGAGLELALTARRHASALRDRPLIRASLLMFAGAGAAGLLYSATFLAGIVAAKAGTPIPHIVTLTIIVSSYQVAFLLLAAAALAPAAGNIWSRSQRAWLGLNLYPLWRVITDQLGGTETDPRDRTEVVVRCFAEQGDHTLSEMVMRVRDGYLQLRPYLDSRIAEMTQRHAREIGVPEENMDALVEAAMLAVALRERAAGHTPAGTGEVDPGAPDLAGEVRWLADVSRAFSDCQVVQLVLVRTGHTSWVEEQLRALGLGKKPPRPRFRR